MSQFNSESTFCRDRAGRFSSSLGVDDGRRLNDAPPNHEMPGVSLREGDLPGMTEFLRVLAGDEAPEPGDGEGRGRSKSRVVLLAKDRPGRRPGDVDGRSVGAGRLYFGIELVEGSRVG